MKAAGLRLAACVVEALPYLDRNTPAVQAEAWKLFEKQVKVCLEQRADVSMHAKGLGAPSRSYALRQLEHALYVKPVVDGMHWVTLTHLLNTVQNSARPWQRCKMHGVLLHSAVLQDKSSDELRAAGAALLGAMCRVGGSYLWTSTGYYAEEALKLAAAGLDDAATVSIIIIQLWLALPNTLFCCAM